MLHSIFYITELMKIPEPINTTIITNRTKFIVFVVFFITGGTALTGYLFYLSKSIFLLSMGIFIFYLFPVIFQKVFRKPFSQNILVTFSENGFITEFSKPDKNNQMKTEIVRLENVKQFKASVENNNDFSTLKIIFKDGSKLNYTFSGQKNDNISETDINFTFKKIVESYNSTKEPGNRIKIIPSFYATKTALYLGTIITLAMAVFTIYFGIKKPSTLIVSIGYVGIYLQMSSLIKTAIKDKEMFE